MIVATDMDTQYWAYRLCTVIRDEVDRQKAIETAADYGVIPGECTEELSCGKD